MPTINRLPSQLTYNDLNGHEAVEILTDWFRQLLATRPELQPHLTLPMARIGLSVNIKVDMYIGGTVPVASPPDTFSIAGQVTLDNRVPGGQSGSSVHVEAGLSQIINVAPVAGGKPPDRVREDHGLPVPKPGYGPRDTGSHLFIADVIEQSERVRADARVREREDNPTGGREGIVADGYQFSSEPASASVSVSSPAGVEQVIPLDRGKIEIDLTGEGKMRQGGQTFTVGTHAASKKVLGDQAGAEYGSVSGTYDAGPAGLARPGHGGGLYSDGRSRISFGNKH